MIVAGFVAFAIAGVVGTPLQKATYVIGPTRFELESSIAEAKSSPPPAEMVSTLKWFAPIGISWIPSRLWPATKIAKSEFIKLSLFMSISRNIHANVEYATFVQAHWTGNPRMAEFRIPDPRRPLSLKLSSKRQPAQIARTSVRRGKWLLTDLTASSPSTSLWVEGSKDHQTTAIVDR